MRVRFWLSVCGITALLGGAAAAYLLRPVDVEARDLSGLVGDPSRGAYLARASGCFSCHTNGAKGGAVLAGGGPLKTPFGTFYAPNITMDRQNGIGAWTVEQFSAALTRGVSPRGENYYPAFVYPNYTRLGDQDIVDLWAAFKTVPPVPETAPAHELSFPFNRRILINAWKRLFFAPGRYEPDPSKSEHWNRGRFLVTGPGHCGACHTPRNLFRRPRWRTFPGRYGERRASGEGAGDHGGCLAQERMGEGHPGLFIENGQQAGRRCVRRQHGARRPRRHALAVRRRPQCNRRLSYVSTRRSMTSHEIGLPTPPCVPGRGRFRTGGRQPALCGRFRVR